MFWPNNNLFMMLSWSCLFVIVMVMMQICCDSMFDEIMFSTNFDKCALYQLEPVIWGDRQSDVILVPLCQTTICENSPPPLFSPSCLCERLIFSKIRAATKASACNALTGDSKLVFASTGSRLLDQKERKWKLREARLDKPARLRFWDECGDPLRAAAGNRRPSLTATANVMHL